MTFDVRSNIFSFFSTSEYKAIWKENLATDQKSLRAFFQAPLQLFVQNLFKINITFNHVLTSVGIKVTMWNMTTSLLHRLHCACI